MPAGIVRLSPGMCHIELLGADLLGAVAGMLCARDVVRGLGSTCKRLRAEMRAVPLDAVSERPDTGGWKVREFRLEGKLADSALFAGEGAARMHVAGYPLVGIHMRVPRTLLALEVARSSVRRIPALRNATGLQSLRIMDCAQLEGFSCRTGKRTRSGRAADVAPWVPASLQKLTLHSCPAKLLPPVPRLQELDLSGMELDLIDLSGMKGLRKFTLVDSSARQYTGEWPGAMEEVLLGLCDVANVPAMPQGIGRAVFYHVSGLHTGLMPAGLTRLELTLPDADNGPLPPLPASLEHLLLSGDGARMSVRVAHCAGLATLKITDTTLDAWPLLPVGVETLTVENVRHADPGERVTFPEGARLRKLTSREHGVPCYLHELPRSVEEVTASSSTWLSLPGLGAGVRVLSLHSTTLVSIVSLNGCLEKVDLGASTALRHVCAWPPTVDRFTLVCIPTPDENPTIPSALTDLRVPPSAAHVAVRAFLPLKGTEGVHQLLFGKGLRTLSVTGMPSLCSVGYYPSVSPSTGPAVVSFTRCPSLMAMPFVCHVSRSVYLRECHGLSRVVTVPRGALRFRLVGAKRVPAVHVEPGPLRMLEIIDVGGLVSGRGGALDLTQCPSLRVVRVRRSQHVVDSVELPEGSRLRVRA